MVARRVVTVLLGSLAFMAGSWLGACACPDPVVIETGSFDAEVIFGDETIEADVEVTEDTLVVTYTRESVTWTATYEFGRW